MGLIATTDDSEFEPRRGYPWEALHAILERELGADYGLLLSEPVPRRGEGRTDWYSDRPGEAHLLAELGPDAQATISETLARMQQDVLKLAARLEAPDPRGAGRLTPDKGLAEELRRAIRVHDEKRFVWSIGAKPVLVAWGRTPFGQPEFVGPISGYVPDRPSADFAPPPAAHVSAAPEPVAPPPPVRPRFRWPVAASLWLLFVAIILAIGWRLLIGCGLAVAPEDSWLRHWLPSSCRVDAALRTDDAELRRRDELIQLIRQAELEAGRIDGACAKPVPLPRSIATPSVSPSPTPSPSPTTALRCAPPELVKRLEQHHAEHGPLEVSLKWDGLEDLDLHVLCPNGDLTPVHGEACGGDHQIDMNYGTNMSSTPVEDVVWKANPPPGEYTVKVTFFSRNRQPDRKVPFEVYVTRDGVSSGPFRGVAQKPNESYVAYKFTIGDDAPPTPSASPTPDTCSP